MRQPLDCSRETDYLEAFILPPEPMEHPQLRFVLGLLAYAAQKDVSPAQLGKLSGVDVDALKQRSSLHLSAKQLNDLWLNASHLSHDPLFGLHLGESLRPAALGIVGEIIQHSRTVGDALTQAAAFIHLITDLFGMEVNRGSRTFTIRFTPYPEREKDFPFMFRQMLDLSMVFVLHELDGLVLEKIQPKEVIFPYLPSNPREYERVLRCRNIRRGAGYSLEFDCRYWEEPILTANYELQGVLLQKVGAVEAPAQPTVRDKITTYLMANSYLGVPSLEAIAANFNTSTRSLQRKLQEEGVTYQQIADSIRKSLALNYMSAGKHPVKEVSYMLGYNELSAFTRAFKRWTGTTPVNYQKG